MASNNFLRLDRPNLNSQKAAQKAAQEIIDSIDKYLKSHSHYRKELLDALRAKINKIDPPPAAIATGAEGQGNPGAELDVKAKIDAERRKRQEEEKAAWEKWRDASKAYNQAKRDYEHWKKAEEYFETRVRPFNEPFRQATELLSYFVPCQTKADYEKRAVALLNKQRHLCGSLQPGRWGECLTSDRLSQLQLPDNEPPPVEADVALFKPSERPVHAIKLFEAETAKLIEETSDYRHDLERMENTRLQNRRLWENIRLLRDFLPAIELLRQFEDAEDRATLAVEIGSKLADAVANHNCTNPEMRFLWLFPDDDAYRETLSIRLDFILAEATCPGLYYRLGASGTPICIIPGRIAEKE